jgi:hypothetical protein
MCTWTKKYIEISRVSNHLRKPDAPVLIFTSGIEALRGVGFGD